MWRHSQALCISLRTGTQPQSSFLELGALYITTHTNQRDQLPMQTQPWPRTGHPTEGTHSTCGRHPAACFSLPDSCPFPPQSQNNLMGDILPIREMEAQECLFKVMHPSVEELMSPSGRLLTTSHLLSSQQEEAESVTTHTDRWPHLVCIAYMFVIDPCHPQPINKLASEGKKLTRHGHKAEGGHWAPCRLWCY